ncbi:MAG: 50S ribosomal protein L16 [Candidatus Kuenenbacteria bacterium]
MLAPKKMKHRKWHKTAGTSGRVASRGLKLSFGSAGMKAMTSGWINAREIEAVRRVLVRFIRKGGRIWVRIFPYKPVTAKGGEVGMGKGKGVVDHYVAPVIPGMILFEMDGIPADKIKEAIKLGGHKLRVKTKFIEK